jgi:hypothetical protein
MAATTNLFATPSVAVNRCSDLRLLDAIADDEGAL